MRLKHFLSVFLTLLTLSVGQMWGATGDALQTMSVSDFNSGYGRKTPTGHIGFGQSGYLGANSGNHANCKPTAADLPVVKAVNSNATTNTTGYYYWYSTNALSNVGSIEFYYSANSGNNSATIYVVSSSTAASSGSATWSQVSLSNSSTSVQGASLGTSGTFTFTLASTETSAKYYGIVIVTSSYKRMTGATLTIKEGATAQCTNPATALSVSSSASATVGTPMTLTTANGNGGPVTWEITSGSDKATLDGATLTPTKEGTVTVKATQDDYTTGGKTYCGGNASKTITITKAPATITLSELGATSSVSGTHYGGDSYTLPTTTTATCTGKTLVGWSTVEIEETDDKPTSNFYAKGESVTLAAGSNTFYAVFAKTSTVFEDDMNVSGTSGYSGPRAGWSSFTKANGGSGSIRLATSNDAGSMTTNALTSLTNTTTTIKFKIKGWSNTEGTVTLSASKGTIATTAFSASSGSSFSEVSTTITGGDNTTQITFSCAKNKRTYIKDIYIGNESKYSTTCCQTLGSINGSFFWTTHFCPVWPAKHRS